MQRVFRFKGPLPNLRARYNVAPTQQVPIVRRAPANGERELTQVRWCLIPFWARKATLGARMINAPAEGIADKPAFRAAFKSRRSLIPADGFYEWQATPGGKVPWRITLKDGEPFAFAGLWERWEKAPDGVPVESCTIITTSANQLVRRLHDRMPVILAPGDYAAWLGEDTAREVSELLRPYPSEAMRAYRVSTAVNRVKNEGPECIEAVELPSEDDVAERGKTKPIDERAKELGPWVSELRELTAKELGPWVRELTSLLFGDQPDSGEVLGRSARKVPSESEIAALPEPTAGTVRELEARRAAKMTEILGYIAALMGHKNLASLDAETRMAVERTAQEFVEHWAREAELAMPSGTPVTTGMQQLLHEHYELGKEIHAYLKKAPHDDFEEE